MTNRTLHLSRRRFLQHIDAVTVSRPDHLHFHASMMAVQRKKHVYCQKSLELERYDS